MSFVQSNKVTLLMSKSSATAHKASVTSAVVDTPVSFTTKPSTVKDYDLGFINKIPGYNYIDGSWFVVESGATTTAFDTIGVAGFGLPTLDPTTAFDVDIYKQADFFDFCVSSIDINRSAPGNIATPTFCNRGQFIPSVVVDKGTLNFSGYVDVNAMTYKELIAAETSQEEKIVVIMTDTSIANSYSVGNADGIIVVGCKINSIDFDLPLDGAIGFSCEAKITRRVQYVNYQ